MAMPAEDVLRTFDHRAGCPFDEHLLRGEVRAVLGTCPACGGARRKGSRPHAAAEAGGQPLLAGLLELALDPARDGEVVAGLLDSGLPDALGRWYRYVAAMAAGHRPLARPDPAPARALMGFADELVWVRRQLLSSNSANDRLLAERLLVCWRRVESARP